MRRRSLRGIVLTVFMVTAVFAASENADAYTARNLNEQQVMGVLWYQRSAEMRALSYQAFNMARMIFDMDLEENVSGKKRAVVVDIDETILDNSPYDVGCIDRDTGYPTGWKDWIGHAGAGALPGAVDFLKYVAEKGGDVYYLSNRKTGFKDATMRNLKKLGFPQVTDEHMLLKEKTSNKEHRRKKVRMDHRIVLLMGDNLNDFDRIFRKKEMQERQFAVDLLKDRFGRKFIVLPNPMYGDWEGAVYGYDWEKTPEQKNGARKSALIRWKKN